MDYFLGWCLFVLVCTVFTGGKTQVVLVPDHDGKVGQAEVMTDGGSQLLSEAGQMAVASDKSKPPSEVVVLEQEKIESMFSAALEAEPVKPQKFILYFLPDSETLTGDSLTLIQDVLASIQARNSSYVSIFGHSDRVGAADYNIDLSTRRALAVRNMLVDKGVAKDRMETASHGEGNPLIPTQDNVAEPRNRRVEIIVR